MVVFFDDFELNNFTRWTGTGDAPTIVSAPSPVHSGTYSMQLNNYDDFAYKSLLNPDPLFFRYYAYRTGNFDAALTSHQLYLWGNGYVDLVGVDIDGNNYHIILTAPSGSYDSGITLTAGSWFCIEVERQTGAGNGLAKLWINGNLEVDKTTENISQGVGELDLGWLNPFQAYLQVNFDDVVADGSYIGPMAESPALGTFLTCLAKP